MRAATFEHHLDAFLETCNDTNDTNDTNNTSQCNKPDSNDCNNTNNDTPCDLPVELSCGLISTRNIALETSSDDESEHNIKLEIESIHSNGNTDISGNEGDVDDTFSEYTTDSEFELESIITENE